MEFRCIKVRLHPGRRARAVEWMRSFGERYSEAVEAMNNNGLRHEVVFLGSDADGDYLLMMQASDDFAATTRAFLNSTLPIDREALAVLDDIGERGQELPVLVQLHANE
ncbi:hypothetical protein FHS23_004164 [Prauserella isguenensis]|uniref:NIPSNAP domain-containing protein n=1 Tax=Prauserella isguenensis TaxID=1470180 RepID=A0A839S4U1_9PSEU|nr:hypothetical protein [Prauserella isguenensis]